MKKELTLSSSEWNLLIKKLGSILSKTEILLRTDAPVTANTRKIKTEQIKQKALECFDIIKPK